MNKKRLILALGATASVAAPIAATISCTAWDDKSVVKESAYTFSIDGVKKSLGQFGHALIREHTITAGQKIGVGTHSFEMTDATLKQFASMGSGDQAKALELVASLAGLDSTDATGFANSFNEELGTGHGGQQIDPANIKAGATAPTAAASAKSVNPLFVEKANTDAKNGPVTPAARISKDELVDYKSVGYIMGMIDESMIPSSVQAGFEQYADKHGNGFNELRIDTAAKQLYFVITKDLPSQGITRGTKVTLQNNTAGDIVISVGDVIYTTVKDSAKSDLANVIKALTSGNGFVQTYFKNDGKSHNFHTMFAQWKHLNDGYTMKAGDFWRIEVADGKFVSFVLTAADIAKFDAQPKSTDASVNKGLAPQTNGANDLQGKLLDTVADVMHTHDSTVDVAATKAMFRAWLNPAAKVAGHGYVAPVITTYEFDLTNMASGGAFHEMFKGANTNPKAGSIVKVTVGANVYTHTITAADIAELTALKGLPTIAIDETALVSEWVFGKTTPTTAAKKADAFTFTTKTKELFKSGMGFVQDKTTSSIDALLNIYK